MATLRKGTGSAHFKRAAGRHGAIIKKPAGLLTIRLPGGLLVDAAGMSKQIRARLLPVVQSQRYDAVSFRSNRHD